MERLFTCSPPLPFSDTSALYEKYTEMLEEMVVLHSRPAGLAFGPGELIGTEDHNPPFYISANKTDKMIPKPSGVTFTHVAREPGPPLPARRSPAVGNVTSHITCTAAASQGEMRLFINKYCAWKHLGMQRGPACRCKSPTSVLESGT